MSWLGRFFSGKRKSVRKPCPRSVTLRVERLEDRLAPIVGAYALPAAIAPLAPVQPASPYDGVVVINAAANLFTGRRSSKRGYTGCASGFEIFQIFNNFLAIPWAAA